MTISIIVPVYGYPESLSELVERLDAQSKILNQEVEIILVNDRCPKDSWSVIKSLLPMYNSLIAINLSRNFGQHYAISAGLAKATGDWVVVMDCDLQDMPEEIPRLYQQALQGFDIVFARRAMRKDSFFKKLGSLLFYKVLSYMTNTKQDERIANFGIYSKKVINAFLSFKEQLRFFPVNIRWLGFNATELDINHSPSPEGVSSYSLSRLIALATNVIVCFSDKPMYLMVRFGIIISFLSLISAALIVIKWLLGDIEVEGWASIMVSIWLMFGLSTMFLGVVGLYVAKAFDESKDRPVFIIDEELTSRGPKIKESDN